jgi:hypothetical protein
MRKYVTAALVGVIALVSAGCASTGNTVGGSYTSREYPDPSRAYPGPYYSSPFYPDAYYASPYYPGGYLPYALNGFYPRVYVPVPVYVVPGRGHGRQGGGQHDGPGAHGGRGGGGFDGPAPKAPLGRHPDRNR